MVSFSGLLWLLAVMPMAFSNGNLWCPPTSFLRERANRVSAPRVSLLTDIHGQLQKTATKWGIFIDGNTMSRFLFHYIGMLGFDRAYIDVMYNASVHLTPPTIEELYPSNKSCVMEWAKLGVIDWFPYKYAGLNESSWEIDSITKKPSMKKDLYKLGRGIIPRYNGIQSRNESDWLFVLDTDELLVPVNFQAGNHSWCHRSHPSLISQGLEQMMRVSSGGTIRPNPSSNTTVACPMGTVATKVEKKSEKAENCTTITSFAFAVYIWSNLPTEQTRIDVMPERRTHVAMPYDYQIIRRNNLSDETDQKYKDWKSIYRLAVAPPMPNTNKSLLLHFSKGYSVRAPRQSKKVLSFELAHIKSMSRKEYHAYLHNDSRLQDLVASYLKCTALVHD